MTQISSYLKPNRGGSAGQYPVLAVVRIGLITEPESRSTPRGPRPRSDITEAEAPGDTLNLSLSLYH